MFYCGSKVIVSFIVFRGNRLKSSLKMPSKKNKGKATAAANDDIDAILAELDADEKKANNKQNSKKKGKGKFACGFCYMESDFFS